MMQTKYIGILIVVLVLVAGGYVFSKRGAYQAPVQNQTQTQTQTQMQEQMQKGGNMPSTNGSMGTMMAKSFTVHGNDTAADLKSITVAKGTPVTITFGADAQGTYHGGLDFRSSVVSTGPIAPGSTKAVSFTADKSFSFTPYWPSTNIAKPYTINVVVQ